MKITVIASGSKGNAYCINDGVSSLLLDAGIPVKRIQENIGFGLSDLAGALISHKHKDHSKAVLGVIRYGVDVYAPREVFEALGVTSHRARVLEAMRGVKVGSYSVMPFDCKHDCVNFGYLIQSAATGERLLYLTDTYYVKYRFERLDYIMAECNYSDDMANENIKNGVMPPQMKLRLMKSHMNVDTLVGMLEANDLSRLKRVYLLHMSERNGDEAGFVERVRRVTGAEIYVC
jgi:phosphoribosyl 1,2-cyclic phosphodiesterase